MILIKDYRTMDSVTIEPAAQTVSLKMGRIDKETEWYWLSADQQAALQEIEAQAQELFTRAARVILGVSYLP